MTASARSFFFSAGIWTASRLARSVVGPAALALHAGEPHGARGVHVDQLVAHLVPAGFEHDRRVEDDELRRRVGLRLVDLLADALLDVRVDQCSRRLRSTGLGKTILPSFLRSTLPSGRGCRGRPKASAMRSRISGCSRASWPSGSPATTLPPWRARAAATVLLPAPMPPTRPMTGLRVVRGVVIVHWVTGPSVTA